MRRYFEAYANGVEPMVELSEAEALARGRYVALDDDPPPIYRRIADGALRTVIYPGWQQPTVPLEHFRKTSPGVPAEIYSPAEKDYSGHHRWCVWYVEPDGQIARMLEQEFGGEGNLLREDEHDGTGALRAYAIYRYDDQGWLIDVTRHAPDGTVLSVQDA
jgi:hypothetical protein